MSRAKTYMRIGCLTALLAVGACGTIWDWTNDQAFKVGEAHRTAIALSKGQAALDACIEAQCNTLDLDGLRLEDYTVLNDMPHVTSLMVSRTNFDDLADINGMSQLKELHITRTVVASLDGLDSFPELELLHAQSLRHEEAIDFSHLAQAPRLKELAVGKFKNPEQAAVVRELSQLERIVFSGVEGADSLDFLRGHRSLKLVDTVNGVYNDRSALLSLPRLEAYTSRPHYQHPIDQQLILDLEGRGVVINEEIIMIC